MTTGSTATNSLIAPIVGDGHSAYIHHHHPFAIPTSSESHDVPSHTAGGPGGPFHHDVPSSTSGNAVRRSATQDAFGSSTKTVHQSTYNQPFIHSHASATSPSANNSNNHNSATNNGALLVSQRSPNNRQSVRPSPNPTADSLMNRQYTYITHTPLQSQLPSSPPQPVARQLSGTNATFLPGIARSPSGSNRAILHPIQANATANPEAAILQSQDRQSRSSSGSTNNSHSHGGQSHYTSTDNQHSPMTQQVTSHGNASPSEPHS